MYMNNPTAMPVPQRPVFHKAGTDTHPECPPDYVYIGNFTLKAARNDTKWGNKQQGTTLYPGGKPKVPLFVPRKDWEKVHGKAPEPEKPKPEPRPEPAPRTKKTSKVTEGAKPSRKGPVPQAKIQRFIEKLLGKTGEETSVTGTKEKVPLPDMIVNGGVPYTWEDITDGRSLFVTVFEGERIIVNDGAKTVNPGAHFPEGRNQKMLEVRCVETGEVRIVRAEGFPEAVLGTTEEQWRKYSNDSNKGVSVRFN